MNDSLGEPEARNDRAVDESPRPNAPRYDRTTAAATSSWLGVAGAACSATGFAVGVAVRAAATRAGVAGGGGIARFVCTARGVGAALGCGATLAAGVAEELGATVGRSVVVGAGDGRAVGL
jgi:hypothetical protein